MLKILALLLYIISMVMISAFGVSVWITGWIVIVWTFRVSNLWGLIALVVWVVLSTILFNRGTNRS